jgi:archaellin
MNSKKGNSSIGILILLITIILITVLFIAIYLASTQKLENQSYSTVDKAKSTITNQLSLVDIYSTYEGEYLQRFYATVKLGSSSDKLDLRTVTISIISENERTSLIFNPNASNPSENSPLGYYTLARETFDIGPLTDDINQDGEVDSLIILADNSVMLNVSGGTEHDVILGNCSSIDTFQKYPIPTHQYISDFEGRCEGLDVVEITLDHVDKGIGYFTVDYLRTTQNHILGTLQKDELVNIYFETQNPLSTGRTAQILIIPRSGAPLEHTIVTPDSPRIGRISLSHYKI